MSMLEGKLWLEPSPNGRTAVAVARCAFVSDIVGRITIDLFDTSDYNSVPRPLWWIWPPQNFPLAGFVHDKLFRTGRTDTRPVTNLEADQVHREILKFCKASRFTQRGMYAGLRSGSWVAWRRYRKADPSSP